MTDAKTEITIYEGSETGQLIRPDEPVTPRNAPAIVKAAGKSAEFAWEEFFQAEIANAHTRKNYMHAVRAIPRLGRGTKSGIASQSAPGDVGEYLQHLELAIAHQEAPPGGTAAILRPPGQPSRLRHQPGRHRQGRAAQRGRRQNARHRDRPGAGPPEVDRRQPTRSGLRDRAVLAVLAYTAARVGAVAKLTMKNLVSDGSQYTLRFAEKGGKSREIPVRHDLEQFLFAYVQAANITDGPLFRTANRKSKMLTKNPMTGIDICRMMKRHLKSAGLPGHFSPHSFRVTTVTDLLEQNVPLEDVQYLAGHADPRTTRIYDRRRRKVTRNIVERISI